MWRSLQWFGENTTKTIHVMMLSATQLHRHAAFSFPTEPQESPSHQKKTFLSTVICCWPWLLTFGYLQTSFKGQDHVLLCSFTSDSEFVTKPLARGPLLAAQPYTSGPWLGVNKMLMLFIYLFFVLNLEHWCSPPIKSQWSTAHLTWRDRSSILVGFTLPPLVAFLLAACDISVTVSKVISHICIWHFVNSE